MGARSKKCSDFNYQLRLCPLVFRPHSTSRTEPAHAPEIINHLLRFRFETTKTGERLVTPHRRCGDGRRRSTTGGYVASQCTLCTTVAQPLSAVDYMCIHVIGHSRQEVGYSERLESFSAEERPPSCGVYCAVILGTTCNDRYGNDVRCGLRLCWGFSPIAEVSLGDRLP